MTLNVFKMKRSFAVLFVCFSFYLNRGVNSTCGKETNDTYAVRVGANKLEHYPWMGILLYPSNRRKYTTAVVLVTRQVVLAAANEIDSLPKTNFRARARVIFGQSCNGTGFMVRDYTYHPEYMKTTHSSFAIVQIVTENYPGELVPICPPPANLLNPTVFALVPSDNCANLSLSIYEMMYVATDVCKEHYRKSGLDVDSMWPTEPACAVSSTGGHCIWRSGSILAMKTHGTWQLLGFHIYGPGCESPARFMDYGMYHNWVKETITRIGKPTITTLTPNLLVLRRSFVNIQRYGPCDYEEKKKRLYDDETTISHLAGRIKYNVSLYADIEYYCVVFKADYLDGTHTIVDRPQLRIREWCTHVDLACSHFDVMEVTLYAEIIFYGRISFGIQAFGKQGKFIEAKRAMLFVNKILGKYPGVPNYQESKKVYIDKGPRIWWPCW